MEARGERLLVLRLWLDPNWWYRRVPRIFAIALVFGCGGLGSVALLAFCCWTRSEVPNADVN
jgi:hypothetical protein